MKRLLFVIPALVLFFAISLQARPATIAEPPTPVRSTANCMPGCAAPCWDVWDTEKAACNGNNLCKWQAFFNFCTCVAECGCPLDPGTICNQN